MKVSFNNTVVMIQEALFCDCGEPGPTHLETCTLVRSGKCKRLKLVDAGLVYKNIARQMGQRPFPLLEQQFKQRKCDLNMDLLMDNMETSLYKFLQTTPLIESIAVHSSLKVTPEVFWQHC